MERGPKLLHPQIMYDSPIRELLTKITTVGELEYVITRLVEQLISRRVIDEKTLDRFKGILEPLIIEAFHEMLEHYRQE